MPRCGRYMGRGERRVRRFLIGVDIGTSGTKAAVVDTEGNILGEALENYPLISTAPGWAEQDAAHWETAVYHTIAAAFKQAAVTAEQVGGICVSGLFAGSGVPVDVRMRPLRPAIIWMDRRAGRQQEEAAQIASPQQWLRLTGNINDAYFGFNKIRWIQENEPDIWAKTHLLLSSNGYVVYRLTGAVTMDVTAAANIGGLYDWQRQDWAYPMLERLNIPASMLPRPLVQPEHIAGPLTAEAAQRTGLIPGIPVCAGCTDCLASILAAGGVSEGHQSAIIGSSINWGLLHRAQPADAQLVSMPSAVNPAQLTYTYGGITTAGVLLNWFRDTVAPYTQTEAGVVPTTLRMLDEEAARIAPGAEGLLALPYFMGERSPIWDADIRGVFHGLSIRHTRAHMYRAILESLGYAVRHIRDASDIFRRAGDTCVVSGGGCRSGLWMQILADVTGLRILPTRDNVQAPVGDAVIAGVATGLLPGYEKAREWCVYRDAYLPDARPRDVYEKGYARYRALYPAVKGI